MEEVHIYRDRRNGLNVEVGEIRDRHRDYLREVKILKENFFKLKRQRFSGKNLPPLSKLRKQIQELENETSDESKLQYLIAISKIEALNSSHYEKI